MRRGSAPAPATGPGGTGAGAKEGLGILGWSINLLREKIVKKKIKWFFFVLTWLTLNFRFHRYIILQFFGFCVQISLNAGVKTRKKKQKNDRVVMVSYLPWPVRLTPAPVQPRPRPGSNLSPGASLLCRNIFSNWQLRCTVRTHRYCEDTA